MEGLCHISELSNDYVKSVEDICKVGDLVPVKLLSIDDQGRFKLSMKAAKTELAAAEARTKAVAEEPKKTEEGKAAVTE